MRVRLPYLAVLLLCSCAAGPAEFLLRPKERMGWPPKQDPPRVEFVMAYSGSESVRRHPGFWTSLWSFFTGEEEQHLAAPYGLALAKDDVLVVADAGQRAVHRISLVTAEHAVIKGTEAIPMETPIGVVVLPDGRMLVTDSSAGHILEFSAGGELLRAIGDPVTLGRPTGIVHDKRQNRLLVVDTTGARILAYNLEGKQLGAYGKFGEGLGEYRSPVNIAVAPNGNVLVTDLNFRVTVLSPDLVPLKTFGLVGRGGGNFASPKGIAVDSQGHIYVVDAMFDNVQVFDPDGNLLLVFSSRGTDIGNLYLPSGIMIDEKDRIFLSDPGNSRVQVFRFNPQEP